MFHGIVEYDDEVFSKRIKHVEDRLKDIDKCEKR